MKQTTKITFAAASLAALIAIPAFAAPVQSETSRIGQAWTIVNERHETGGIAGEVVGPVFQAEVDHVLRSGQPLNEVAVQVAPTNSYPMMRNQPRLIEPSQNFGG